MDFWHWSIGLGIGTAVFLYVAGLRHMFPSGRPERLPRSWRVASFFAAVLALLAALFSPIHTLSTQYFSLHVLQRLLLVAVVPSLLLSGNPGPILLAGLPQQIRQKLGDLHRGLPRVSLAIRQISRPVPVWFLFVCTFWLWHDAQVTRLLLQTTWVHRLENVTLLGTAVIYWWHIMAVSPRLHEPMPLLWRVGYAALGATPVKLVGLVLMFTSPVIYDYPAEISIYNLEITDQSLGAAIVWAVGGVVFTWTAVMLMRTWLKEEDEKPILPETVWSSEEMMLAPGFNKPMPFSRPSK